MLQIEPMGGLPLLPFSLQGILLEALKFSLGGFPYLFFNQFSIILFIMTQN